MITEIIFALVVYCVVLSWTDLQSHVGYAYCIAKGEGWWKFPLIWVQSFVIPTSFLRSGKTQLDFSLLAKFERAARFALTPNTNTALVYDTRRNSYIIKSSQNKNDINFSIPKNDSVEIDNYDKLVPPRLAFLMLACRSEAVKNVKEAKSKKVSILD